MASVLQPQRGVASLTSHRERVCVSVSVSVRDIGKVLGLKLETVGVLVTAGDSRLLSPSWSPYDATPGCRANNVGGIALQSGLE